MTIDSAGEVIAQQDAHLVTTRDQVGGSDSVLGTHVLLLSGSPGRELSRHGSARREEQPQPRSSLRPPRYRDDLLDPFSASFLRQWTLAHPFSLRSAPRSHARCDDNSSRWA